MAAASTTTLLLAATFCRAAFLASAPKPVQSPPDHIIGAGEYPSFLAWIPGHIASVAAARSALLSLSRLILLAYAGLGPRTRSGLRLESTRLLYPCALQRLCFIPWHNCFTFPRLFRQIHI